MESKGYLFAWFDTEISSKDSKLVCSMSIEMNCQQTYGGSIS